MRAMIVIAALAACYSPPDYRRTHFACKQSRACPEGLMCSEDHCVPPSDDELLVDQTFVISRDEASELDYAACATAGRCPAVAGPIRGLPRAAVAAYCAFREMRAPTAAELRAAEAAGVELGDGVRCVR